MQRLVRAINRTKGTILCESLETASSLSEQTRGLLGRDRLESDSGMLFMAGPFPPFMWMHMFFMRFPIDIVFLSRDNRVLRINHDLKPWRVSSLVFGARQALELHAGAAARTGTMVGDEIAFEDHPSSVS